MRGKGSVFLIIWASLMTLIVLGLVGFEMVRMFGKSNLSAKSATSTPMMAGSDYDVQPEGQSASYDGYKYTGVSIPMSDGSYITIEPQKETYIRPSEYTTPQHEEYKTRNEDGTFAFSGY